MIGNRASSGVSYSPRGNEFSCRGGYGGDQGGGGRVLVGPIHSRKSLPSDVQHAGRLSLRFQRVVSGAVGQLLVLALRDFVLIFGLVLYINCRNH